MFYVWTDFSVQWNRLIQNSGIMLLRNTVARREHSQVDELIARLSACQRLAQSKEMESLLNKQLGEFFVGLHRHLSEKNLCQLKAFQTLPDGIYVLLKGQVSYMFASWGQGGGSSATIITKPWTIFQCALKNCASVEETWLLRLGEEELQSSNFRACFERRKMLYEGQYLSQDHFSMISAQEQPIKVDLRIHSNFSFVSFNFRQLITLDSPAILCQGRARLKSSLVRSYQFDRFGVMLPRLTYEVTSSQAEILVIANNETLRCSYRLLPVKGSKAIVSHCRTEPVTPGGKNHKEQERRFRELGKFFKQAENYSILSSFLCEKSLDFAKKHNEKHCTKQKREGRYRNPLVLFSIAAQKTKLVLPSFQDLNSTMHSPKATSLNKTASNHSAILKKLKLHQADHQRFLSRSKPKTQTLHSQLAKVSRHRLNLTFDRVETDVRDFQDEEFSPYNSKDE